MITPQDIAYRRYVAVRSNEAPAAYAIYDTADGKTVKTIKHGISDDTLSETYRRALVEAARMNQEDFRERKALRSSPIVRGSEVTS